MPLRAQLGDLVVQVRANLAAHRHHHGLPVLGVVALFKVRHQVRRHAGNARLRAHYFLQRGPAALELGLQTFFFVFGQLVYFFVQVAQLALIESEFGQAAFVINGNGRAVFLRLLHVVHMDVVTEHRARVAVGAAHRRAGEGHKGGLGQRVAQVLGVARLVLGGVFGRGKVSRASQVRAIARGIGHSRACAIFHLARLELGLKAVLGAVRLVSNHHDVAPSAEYGEGVFIFPRHELLDGRKNDPARRPVF